MTMIKETVDFIGIGAQKSGTSWLWSLLRAHPAIWMPPKKELHYFDRSLKYSSSAKYLASEHFFRRMVSQQPHNQAFRKKFASSLLQAYEARNWSTLQWTLRYYCRTYNDRWYVSLFKEGKGLVKGEITPSYSLLDTEDVQHIKQLFPNLKIILLLRNPIDRA
ncbi:MAG: sulfotransferase [Cyanobacteria bacterium J06560_6]